MNDIILYHGIAFFCGFLLDLILGDPEGWPHPVRWIGALIAYFDKKYLGAPEEGEVYKKSDGHDSGNRRRSRRKDYRNGVITVILVVLASAFGAAVPLLLAYLIHPVAGIVVEAWLTYWMLAITSLRKESKAVYRHLKKGDLPGARKQVARIVGRDTDVLNEAGVTRAAIETVAESTCDGIAAPLLYFAIGGPILGYAAKAINTMDSMIGYKNARYRNFGRCAALTDDAVNYLPARISAAAIVAAAFMIGKPFLGTEAYRIYKRDHAKTESPNAGLPESAMAGALGIALGGNAVYSGLTIKKPVLGDPGRDAVPEDIRRANTLMLTGSSLIAVLFTAAIAVIYIILR